MPWIMFAAGFAFFRLAGRAMSCTPQNIGALILTGSLANTSFVGLPMIEAFYGNTNGELAIGICIDQLGTYMVLTTLGILVATAYSAENRSPSALVKKILGFPPFQALVLTIVLMPVEYSPGVETAWVRPSRHSRCSAWVISFA